MIVFVLVSEIIFWQQVCERSEGKITFEPMQNSNPPVDEVRALEQLSLQPKSEVRFVNKLNYLYSKYESAFL